MPSYFSQWLIVITVLFILHLNIHLFAVHIVIWTFSLDIVHFISTKASQYGTCALIDSTGSAFTALHFVKEHWVSAAAFNIDTSHFISEHCIGLRHRAINKDHPVFNFVCVKNHFAEAGTF